MRTDELLKNRALALTVRVGCGSRDIEDPAELYHEASKQYPDCLVRPPPITGTPVRDAAGSWVSSKARSYQASIRLPRHEAPSVPLMEVLQARRSANPTGRPLSMYSLATLLYAAYGVTGVGDSSHHKRSAPSAGGLYPLDWYVAGLGSGGLDPGVYHYEPHGHLLEAVSLQDPRTVLERALVGPDPLSGASVVFAITALFARTRRKYGLRGYRFALIEAGHSMQNLLLAATCLGIGATPVGGFMDNLVDELVQVNGVDETTLYVAVAG